MIYDFLGILGVDVGSSIGICYLIGYFFPIYTFISTFFLGYSPNLTFKVFTISRLKHLLLLASFINSFDTTAY